MTMNSTGSSDFKFSGSGEEQQDSLLQRKRKNRRVAKSGARLTVFFIFLLMVLGGLFAFAYMDIKKRVALLEDAGERNVQEMVQEMEAQVARVSQRYDEMQKSLTKKVFPMDEIFLTLESSASALEERLDEIASEVEALRADQDKKVDKADIDKAVAGVTEALPPIRERLDSLASGIKDAKAARQDELADFENRISAYEERMKEMLKAVQEYVDAADQTRKVADKSFATLNKEIAGLKAELAALTSVAIDQKTLEKALNSQSAVLQRRIGALAAGIGQNENAIKGLRSKLSDVQKTAEASARILRENPPRAIKTPPRPGTFLEQDIQ